MEVTSRFRDALVALYASILTFLAKGLHYYEQGTAGRIAKSLFTTVNDVQAWSSPIAEKQTEVQRLANVAEAEKADAMATSIAELREEQSSQGQKLSQTHQDLKKLLEDLQLPIGRLGAQLSYIQDGLERQSRIKLLNSISTIKYFTHNKVVARDRMQNSGMWLLHNERFRDWREERLSSVLWLHGMVGSGKTKIASLVIDELQRTARVAYFYCMRNPAEPERAQCDKVLRCLVRQLASISLNDPILEPVRLRYEDAIDGDEDFDDQEWTSDESTEILIELTNVYPSVTIVIDALDEVLESDRLDLVDALTAVLKESESLVKIFISSRDNVDITLRLEGTPNLRIGAKENSEDIDNFVYSTPIS